MKGGEGGSYSFGAGRMETQAQLVYIRRQCSGSQEGKDRVEWGSTARHRVNHCGHGDGPALARWIRALITLGGVTDWLSLQDHKE